MKQPRRKTVLYSMGLFGGLVAVAMWGKMRFVSKMPKIAYADPNADRGDGLIVPSEGDLTPEEARMDETAPDTGGVD